MSNQKKNDVRETIRAGYADIAETGSFVGAGSQAVREKLAGGSCCGGSGGGDGGTGGGSCCGPSTISVGQLAEEIGYSADELTALPEGANMGLSCGNPTAIASLQDGEVVVDLGSGGGFDVFLAGPKVGEAGRAIGVDMTHEMISKARRNMASYTKATGLENVEFRLGEIEALPLGDRTADAVLSNCVINLSVDKPRVWREIFRVLKPGGRVAISDIALLRELPEAAKTTAEDWVGCVAGASLVDDIRSDLTDAGFENIELTTKPEYVRAMTQTGDPLYARLEGLLPDGVSAEDCITSLDITAMKPAKVGCC